MFVESAVVILCIPVSMYRLRRKCNRLVRVESGRKLSALAATGIEPAYHRFRKPAQVANRSSFKGVVFTAVIN
jgi:hypothetical protein